ncbi:hypothetical protein CLG96_14140 [Sphingomonas oleivorans]|uniref:Uncharacterized protein n=1 Tax=Sphingomonas oleivorans TaxID=1735121 RepID=A0A2T5FWU7_9SPHN|nr:hypothetical protein [Sphingomonas oleivorans]PTQ10246.1 hypothetical protein CLG96_14140 [Sphingomonas oleivorans]
MIKRLILAALLTASLPAAAVAQTASRCMPNDEAAGLVTFALPTLVERLAERCRPTLPGNAYLSASSVAIADRYRADAASAWPVARKALEKLFDQFMGQPMPADFNSELARQLAGPMIATLLAEKVKTEDCAAASQTLETLTRLSGRETGRLVALAAAVADRKGDGIAGALRVCKPGMTR